MARRRQAREFDGFLRVDRRAVLVTSPSSVPVGFATGTLDPIGLLYLQARYYHPHYGRFISPDPIVQDVFTPIAWNAYAYCRNNPQSYVDPTGREWWKILVGALAVVALVVLAVVTFGAATPLSVSLGIAIIAGVVAGGVDVLPSTSERGQQHGYQGATERLVRSLPAHGAECRDDAHQSRVSYTSR
jgi:RHS repeat-associated protein